MKKFLFLGLSAILAAGFTACKDDTLVDTTQSGNSFEGETGYISFRIKSADTGGMTRGDSWLDQDDKDYQDGTGSNLNDDVYAGEDDIVKDPQANRVFFFDSTGKFWSSAPLVVANDEPSSGHETGSNHATQYPEKVFTCVVKRTKDRVKEQWPTQCLVILNGRPARISVLEEEMKNAGENDSALELFLEKWTDSTNDDVMGDEDEGSVGLYKNGVHYFTMTNSIYWNNGENGPFLQSATKIDEGKFKGTYEAALEDAVTVYVERVVAKIEVGFSGYGDPADGSAITFPLADGKKIIYYPKETEMQIDVFTEGISDDDDSGLDEKEENLEKKSVKILIEGWGVNGMEYGTFLFKSLGTLNVTSGNLPGSDPFTGWNDITHHRSYWAIDEHYDYDEEKNEYPSQYRRILGDQESIGKAYQDGGFIDWEYEVGTKEAPNDIFNQNYKWVLDYKSYADMTNDRPHKYTLENTFAVGGADDNYRHLIMGTHLIIKARLLYGDEGDDTALGDISDKYRYDNVYYDENTYIKRIFKRLNNYLAYSDNSCPNYKAFLDDNDGDNFEIEQIKGGIWTNVNGQFVKIKAQDADQYFDIAPAYERKSDGKVTIALKAGYESKQINLYYCKEKLELEEGSQPDATKLTQFTRNELISLLYELNTVADCFKKGRMYYMVPIKHYGVEKEEDGKYSYKYSGIVTGDYGVVRNHWYKFEVNNIAKIGIPVHDPDQPIIPNYDDEDGYIGMQVIILPWHIVNNGKVTLE